MANLVRVLEATLKGPRRSSQRPTNPRPHTDQGGTASAGDRTDFQPGTGRPTGGTETNPDRIEEVDAAHVVVQLTVLARHRVGCQPVCPVVSCGAPTGLDSGDPRCRRYTLNTTIDPTASISDCQF